MPSKLFVATLAAWFIAAAPVGAAAENDVFAQSHQSISSTEAALSVNEPMYFVAGGGDGDDIKGRFQFSFKYRVFDDDSEVTRSVEWLRGFHFAYTQTSLWNLSADSAPF